MKITKNQFQRFFREINKNFPPDNPPNTVAMHDKLLPKELAEKKAEFKPRWKKRLKVAQNFMDNFEVLTKNVQDNLHNNATLSRSADFTFDSLKAAPSLGIITQGLERTDGAEHAASFPNPPPPIVVIAGNSSHIGGSAYRAVKGKKAGDAQEEKFADTLPIALAIAAKVGDGFDHGDIKYKPEIKTALEQRGALQVTGIKDVDGKEYNAIVCVAPDLQNDMYYKSIVSIGEIDPKWDAYIKEIYIMYNNLGAALAASDPNQPIVLTSVGAGVFSNKSPYAQLIQGVCLRMAFENNPALKERAQKGLVSLPRANQKVMEGFQLDAKGHDIKKIFERVDANIKYIPKVAEKPKAVDKKKTPKEPPPVTHLHHAKKDADIKNNTTILFTAQTPKPNPTPSPKTTPKRPAEITNYKALKAYLDRNTDKLDIKLNSYRATADSLEFKFNNLGKVYAQNIGNNQVAYSVSTKLSGPALEETIKKTCRLAVSAGTINSVFDLSRCPEDKKEATYNALTQAINQKYPNPDGKKPTITGYEPPKQKKEVGISFKDF